MIIKNRRKIYLEQIDKEFPKAAQDEEKQKKIQLLNDLEAFEKKYSGKQVIASLMQLAKVDSPFFDTSVGKLMRSNCQIECAFYVELNWKYATAGKLYILDEEATEKNIAEMELHLKSVAEKAALENEVGANVADAIKAIGQSAKAKVKASAVVDEGQSAKNENEAEEVKAPKKK